MGSVFVIYVDHNTALCPVVAEKTVTATNINCELESKGRFAFFLPSNQERGFTRTEEVLHQWNILLVFGFDYFLKAENAELAKIGTRLLLLPLVFFGHFVFGINTSIGQQLRGLRGCHSWNKQLRLRRIAISAHCWPPSCCIKLSARCW